MSIDTTFKPIGATFLVSKTAVRRPDAKNPGPLTVRIHCIADDGAYLSWGGSDVTAKGAPTATTPSPNTVGISNNGQVEYLEVPPDAYFISDTTDSFEITPGTGGSGGAG